MQLKFSSLLKAESSSCQRFKKSKTLQTSAMIRLILMQLHTVTTGSWPVQASGQITVGQWSRKVLSVLLKGTTRVVSEVAPVHFV